MMAILASILPVFLVIAVGFAAVRTRLFPEAGLAPLGSFVIRIALPAMFFRSLSQRAFAEVMDLRYLSAYGFASLLMLGLGLAWSRWLRKQPLETGAIIGMGMSCANSAYIGYPVALQVVGPLAGTALAMCALVENVLMIPLVLAIADSASATHERFARALARALARLRHNPMVIGIVLGTLASLLHVPVHPILARTLDLIGGTAPPMALFVIGGNLVGLAWGAVLVDVQAISYSKLLLHPLAVAALMLAIGPAEPALRVAAIVIASAPMLSIYPIFGARHALQGLCAAALLLATSISFLTMSAVAWLLGSTSPLPQLFR
jgi:predicted permease